MERKIISFLSSTKLTVFLFILLIPLLIIGGTIPQNYPPSYYVREYSNWHEVIFVTGINHIFKTPSFLFLLTMLFINVIACLSRRFPQKFRAVHSNKMLSPSQIKNLRTFITSNKTLDYLKDKAIKQGYKPKNQMENGIFLSKGSLGWWGAEIAHAGLILIFIGGIITALFSEHYYLELTPGERDKFGQNYFLQLDDFKMPLYEDGTPKQYISKISILQGEALLKEVTIWVNKPARINGYWIYQSNYGTMPFKIKTAELEINFFTPETFEVPFNKPTTLETIHGKIEIFCPLFIPDFAFDIEKKEIYSRSLSPKNPALFCSIKRGNKKFEGWLFLNFPNFNTLTSSFKIKLKNYTPLYYSGIEIRKDPGTTIFFLGGLILFVGVILSFYIPYQRIWIVKDGEITRIGGISYRGEEKLKKEIKEIAGENNEMV